MLLPRQDINDRRSVATHHLRPEPVLAITDVLPHWSNASRLRLQRSRGGWKLDIEGDRVVTWGVRWHTGTGIVEAGSSRAASASFIHV